MLKERLVEGVNMVGGMVMEEGGGAPFSSCENMLSRAERSSACSTASQVILGKNQRL